MPPLGKRAAADSCAPRQSAPLRDLGCAARSAPVLQGRRVSRWCLASEFGEGFDLTATAEDAGAEVVPGGALGSGGGAVVSVRRRFAVWRGHASSVGAALVPARGERPAGSARRQAATDVSAPSPANRPLTLQG